MAANLQRRGFARFGKLFLEGNRIGTVSDPASFSASRIGTGRASQFSVYVYEKNVEEDAVCSTVVPDDLIPPHSDKYWAPHPQTGVFGPPGEDHTSSSSSSSLPLLPTNGSSVLDQKAWFRQLEDVDQPHDF
ncbi:hydrogen peroxide induced protein 1 [Cinnamomum micranthum f. kanehirae]|uniref:Hydrogen peroxide induced protein 1 n=1 Tax=Cinnamomum micranthum f. kanehirae TaxID=337451 RepID=A0A3S3NZ93_9MAGN|nr:hydrogen peroxide induced protein 1 [Cinnamomum micranthum f. kanehirae]